MSWNCLRTAHAPTTIGAPFPKNPGSLSDCLEAYTEILRVLCVLCGPTSKPFNSVLSGPLALYDNNPCRFRRFQRLLCEVPNDSDRRMSSPSSSTVKRMNSVSASARVNSRGIR